MYSGLLVHSPSAAHLSQLACWSAQSPPAPTVLSNESTWIHFVADHFSPSITGHPAWRLSVSGVAFGWRLKNRSASPLRGFTVHCHLPEHGKEGEKQLFNRNWQPNREGNSLKKKLNQWPTCYSFFGTLRQIIALFRSSVSWRFLRVEWKFISCQD